MRCEKYLPEGSLINTKENSVFASNIDTLTYAMENRIILEGIATLCDTDHNLAVDFCNIRGLIPRRSTALGIDDGKTREIAVISRVGKPVAFVIEGIDEDENGPILMLSRRNAQLQALSHILNTLHPGDIIPARITHLEPFGAFVDVGCGIISLIGIETLSVSRISHPDERFHIGDEVYAIITGFDYEKQRIFLSHRELLGTWEENASRFEVGQTVRGIVRGVEDYGIFIELSPNLSGLAEYHRDVKPGDAVSVFIKSIIPDKMKIKLIIIDVFPKAFEHYITKGDYRLTHGHIDTWRYSPEECTKKEIMSIFNSKEL